MKRNEFIELASSNNCVYRCSDKGYELFKQAISCFYDQDADSALEELAKAIKYEDDYYEEENALYLYAMGYILEELGEYEDAIEQYSRSYKFNKNQYWINFNIGVCHQYQTNYLEAINYFNKVLSVDFVEYKDIIFKEFSLKRYIVLNNRGICFAMVGNSNHCIEDCSNSIKLNSKYSKPYLVRGIEYLKLNKKVEAKLDLDMALLLGEKSSNKTMEGNLIGEKYDILRIENFADSEQAKRQAGGVRLRELFRTDLITLVKRIQPKTVFDLETMSTNFLFDMCEEFIKNRGAIDDFNKSFFAYEVTKAIISIYPSSKIGFNDFFKSILSRVDNKFKSEMEDRIYSFLFDKDATYFDMQYKLAVVQDIMSKSNM